MPPEELARNPWLIAAYWLALLAMAGSLTAWVWALARLVRGRPLLTDDAPRVVPWGAGSVAAVAILYLALNYAVAGVYAAIQPGPSAPPDPVPAATGAKTTEISPTDQLVLMVVINLLAVALVPLLLRWTSGARAEDFGLVGPRVFGRDLARGCVASLMLGPLVYGLFLAAQQVWKPTAHPVQEVLTQGTSGVNTLLVAISAVVAAPLAEELLFRGVLLGWMTRAATLATRRPRPEPIPVGESKAEEITPSELPPEPSVWAPPRTSLEPPLPPDDRPTATLGLGAWVANIMVAFFFAGLHAAQWPAPVPLFVLAIGLGWLAQRTGRLVGPVALHATFNGFSTAMLLLVSGSGVELPEQAPAPASQKAGWEPASRPGRKNGDGLVLVNLTGRLGDLRYSSGPPGASPPPASRSSPGAGRNDGDRSGPGPGAPTPPSQDQTRSGPWMRKAPHSSATSSGRPPAVPQLHRRRPDGPAPRAT